MLDIRGNSVLKRKSSLSKAIRLAGSRVRTRTLPLWCPFCHWTISTFSFLLILFYVAFMKFVPAHRNPPFCTNPNTLQFAKGQSIFHMLQQVNLVILGIISAPFSEITPFII